MLSWARATEEKQDFFFFSGKKGLKRAVWILGVV